MRPSSSAVPRRPASARAASRRALARTLPSTRSRSSARTASRRATTVLLAVLGVLAATVLPATAAPATVTPGPAIESYSSWQGQTTCDPVVRPGAAALRDLVLASYPGTGDSGIVRACHVGGGSEHKEGRAWDWRVNTSNPTHVEQVADLMAWLLADDEHGNTAAMARRLGIMYMIWDSKIWKSYQAARGWQPYVGPSPHTDHVHFSLSWAGAYAKTSYWTGTVAPTMHAPAPPPRTSDTPTTTIGTSPSSPPPPGAVSATPTATVGTTTGPAPSTLDRRAQRRLFTGRLPGPWKRH